jgi:outer membrane scaffolding protein for murein synthesis (MipA/OmpV family)
LKRDRIGVKALFVAAALQLTGANAQQRPLWEAGLGVAGVSFPDYRGSNERTNYVLPLPYFVYRGEFLKADRQKVRGVFFKNSFAELDVSISGTPPVRSKNNSARLGMPDLDATLELGPSLNLKMVNWDDKRYILELRLPLRTVTASDFNRVHYEGLVFQPQLNLDIHDIAGVPGLNLGVAAGPVFADRRYHHFIYGVDAPYATALRPLYQGRGGYGGSQFVSALSKRFPDFWAGAFIKYDNLSGAAVENSPLMKSKSGFTAGFGIAWVLGESKTRVDARD